MAAQARPGWYPDRSGRAALRWWDGATWTVWASDGQRVWSTGPTGPTGTAGAVQVRPSVGTAAAPVGTTAAPVGSDPGAVRLAFVRHVLLPEAVRRGLVGTDGADALAGLADELVRTEAAERAAGRRAPTARWAPANAAGTAEAADTAATASPPTAAVATGLTATVPSPASTGVDGRLDWSTPAAATSALSPATPLAPPAGGPGTSYPPAGGPGISSPPAGGPGTSSPPAGTPTSGPAWQQAARPARPPRPPGRVARWWAELRGRGDTDLTVHGLAYLGVLLLFVGVFGLVAFAFGDVAPALRPVAELAVAVVPFLAAGLLHRSGALFVARAMVGVGGLLLPLMLVTSTVDGYPVPPDLKGPALPAGLAVGLLLLAGAYAWWVRRRPDSGLRPVVAPVVWLAAAMGALGLARPLPSGQDVAVPGAAQVAVIALAVLLTTALAARRPAGPVAEGALRAGLPGTVVVLVLALTSWAAEGWPVLPVLVTGAALAATWQLLPAVSGRVADVAVAVWWWVLLLRVAVVGRDTPLLSAHDGVTRALTESGRPVAALVGAAALLVLAVLAVEVLGRAGRTPTALGLLVLGVLPALVLLLPEGWWGVAAAALVTAWAVVRRADPYVGTTLLIDVLAGAAPLLLVLAVAATTSPEVGLITAGAVVLAATPLARGTLARRDHLPAAGPGFWSVWWAGAAGAVLLGTLLAAAGGLLTADDPGRWAVPVTALLVAVAVALGPLRPAHAIAATTPVLWWSWLATAVAGDLPAGVRGGALAAAGLAAVVLGTVLRPGASGRRPLAALASAGHVTAAVAVAVVGVGRPLVGALAALTAGWAVTALATDRDASALGRALDRRGDVGRLGPWVLVLVSAPATLWAGLHVEGVLPVTDPWAPAVLMGTAIAYAALTRAVRAGRVAVLLPWVAFAAALLAPLLSTRPWPLVAALGALVVQVLLTRPPRQAVMSWTAWAVLAPAVGLAAHLTFPEVRALGGPGVVAATTIAVGGLMLVGAFLADRADPRDPRWLPYRPAAVAPAVLGALQLLVGLTAAFVVPDPAVQAALLLAGAGVLAVTAALSGVGTVGALGALVVWSALRPLLGDAHPGAWADVVVAAGILGVAQGVSLLGAPRLSWARWDVSFAVAAAVPAVAALAVAPAAERPLVHGVVGVLAVGAAVRLRRRRALAEVLGWAGTAVLLVGAVQAGPGWTVALLVLLSAAHTTLAATREGGLVRVLRQWVGAGAALGAWSVVPVAAGWTAQQFADVTAVVGGVLALALVATAAAGRLDREWLLPWGAVAVLLAVTGGLRLVTDPTLLAELWPGGAAGRRGWTLESADAVGAAGVVPSWWQVAGLALLGAAVVLVERVARWGGARDVGLLVGLVAVLTGFVVAGAGAGAQVTVLVALAGAGAAATVLAREHDWRRPPTTLAVGALAAAAGVAVLRPLDGGGGTPSTAVLLAGVLAGAAVVAAAAGVAWRELGLRLVAPVLAWVAWAVYAAQALDGEIVWFTVPVGLALLVVVAVWRADRRARGLAPSDGTAVALELIALAFLVLASVVAAFTESVLHAFVVAGIGAAVVVWGMLTRVRRRLTAGAALVLGGVVLAVALPLVAILPAWGQAGAWVLVAVVGLVVVVAATFLERGRSALHGGRARLHDLTAGWE